MALISTKETVVGMKRETVAGTAATLGAMDIFEVNAPPTMQGTVEQIERTVLRGTLDDLATVAGKKGTGGNVGVEPVGGGTSNPVPQWGALTEAAFGGRPVTQVIAVYKAFADDGGVFTDETTAANEVTADDVTLLPAVEVIGDAYYFGDLARFSGVRLNISTAGVGTAVVWEYYNGSAWVDLSTVARGFIDNTVGLTVAGTKDVLFEIPTDWAVTTVNAITTTYWVRLRCTAGSFTTQPKAAQAWLLTRGTASLVVAASTTTVLIVTTGHGLKFKAGMAVACQIGTDDHVEGRFITSISTDALTVSPPFTAAPTTGKAVYPTASFNLGAGLSAYSDAWTIEEWFASVFFKHTLCKCTSMDFNAPNVGAIPSLQFTFQGKEGISGAGAPPAFLSTPGLPIMAMSCQLYKAGVAIDLTSLMVKLANTATVRGALNSSGVSDIAITKRRTEGSFNVFMEDKTFYDDYLAGTEFELFAQVGTARGNMMLLRCPAIKYTAAPIGDKDEAKEYQMTFRANTVAAAGNDSLYMAFA